MFSRISDFVYRGVYPNGGRGVTFWRHFAVDADEWEFGIGGVEGAGYVGVPMHKEPVQRGKVTELTYKLRRKE